MNTVRIPLFLFLYRDRVREIIFRISCRSPDSECVSFTKSIRKGRKSCGKAGTNINFSDSRTCPIPRATAAEFSRCFIEPSSNCPEFLTWYAISAVSWRDAQSLPREGLADGVETKGANETHGNPGQVIATMYVARSGDRKWLQVSLIYYIYTYIHRYDTVMNSFCISLVKPEGI